MLKTQSNKNTTILRLGNGFPIVEDVIDCQSYFHSRNFKLLFYASDDNDFLPLLDQIISQGAATTYDESTAKGIKG